MAFKDLGITAHPGLRNDTFIVRPITSSDADLDYEAVMETRDFLRKWERSTWPEDDFTAEANREDMQKMEQRHLEGYAFGYTVMNPSETECFGCVYIFATDAKMYAEVEVESVGSAQWSEVEATVDYWVRESRIAEGMNCALVDALRGWFDDDWGLNHYVFMTNEQLDRQIATLESAGLAVQFRLTGMTGDTDAAQLAYG